MERKNANGIHKLDIDFVAPHSLDDCAYLFGRLHERRDIPFAPVVAVELRNLDDDTYAFRLNEAVPAPVVIHGYFNRLHNDSTYVSGVATIRRFSLYRDLLLGLLLILLLALVVGPLILLVYLPVFVIFVMRYHSGVQHERARLVRLMCETLSG